MAPAPGGGNIPLRFLLSPARSQCIHQFLIMAAPHFKIGVKVKRRTRRRKRTRPDARCGQTALIRIPPSTGRPLRSRRQPRIRGTDIHLICRFGYGIQPGVSGIDGIANIPAARQADATVAPGTARAPRTAEGRRQIKTAGSPEERVQQAARPARHSPLPGYGERAVIL